MERETLRIPCIDHQYLEERGNQVIEVRPNHLHEIQVHNVDTGIRQVQIREAFCVEVLG